LDVSHSSRGDEVRFWSGFPSPRASPDAFLAGRGRRRLSLETVSPARAVVADLKLNGAHGVTRPALKLLEVGCDRFSNRIFHFLNRRWIFQRRDIAWLFSQIRRANDAPHHFRISRSEERRVGKDSS